MESIWEDETEDQESEARLGYMRPDSNINKLKFPLIFLYVEYLEDPSFFLFFETFLPSLINLNQYDYCWHFYWY
jgi:hypothetical protein